VQRPIFVLGGHQTDFGRHLAREGAGLEALAREATLGAFDDASIDPAEVCVVHVGNAFGELFTGQAHLGAMPATVCDGLWGTPAARHEAACASGSIAALAAMAEIEAGRYECALVLGLEQERNVRGDIAAQHLGAAAWVGHEAEGARYLWPFMFSAVGDAYEARYGGLRREHLTAIARKNFDNARNNPLAQTRSWVFTEASFAEDDEKNPVIEGRIRRQDCAQVTDGGAALILASASFAEAWARARGRSLDALPRVIGWGHTTAGLPLADKLARTSGPKALLFPHVKRAIDDAFRRAGIGSVFDLDGIETHDCFTPTEYMAIDHFGITAPGESWKAIEEGVTMRGGRLPVNASGGLIGGGHPVGATGVRMLLDACRQVEGRAGATQLEGVKRFGTLNLGGSATTVVSFVVGRG
jgi:acetyl-CoA C-acetyltransferase